jgi:hypothetical protein
MAPLPHCLQEYPDDAATLNEHQMLRRVHPKQVIFDSNMGRSRPSSAAFEDDRDRSPMSMYSRAVIDATGGDILRVMAAHPGYSLVGLSAGDLRSRDQTVHSDPLPDEPAHALICGAKTDSNRKFFYQHSVWVIPPPED